MKCDNTRKTTHTTTNKQHNVMKTEQISSKCDFYVLYNVCNEVGKRLREYFR